LQTNEVIAERIGYMVDAGQGSQAGGRMPWAFADQNACPSFPQIGPSDSRRQRNFRETVTSDFANKVLQPKQGE